MRLVIGVLVAVSGAFALYKSAACVWPHSCTEIGCNDGVSLSLFFADHRWEEGTYALEVTLDDTKHACNFTWPEARPEIGRLTEVLCEPQGLEATFRQDVVCSETRTADARSQSCTPIAGQYTLTLSSFTTPARMQLRVQHDGALISDRDLTLTYTDLQPNGPDCGPPCRVSDHDVQLD